jgi:hypothetical protein
LGPRMMGMGNGEGSIEELHSSANVVRVIQSRSLRVTGHIAKMEEFRSEKF